MITKWEELMMPVTSRQPRRLIDAELGQVLALAKDADNVELKLAAPDASATRPSSHWAWGPLEAQIRQVYFFDTADPGFPGRLRDTGLLERPGR